MMTSENKPFPPAVATTLLAAEYQAMTWEAVKRTVSDPWLRWLTTSPFETICEAIEVAPEAFFASYLALRAELRK